MDTLFTDIRKTLAMSAGLHVLLMLLFIFTETGFDFDTSGFTEVSFVASSQAQSDTPAPAPSSVVESELAETPPEATEAEQPEPEQQEPASAGGAELSDVPVNLPQRRMLAEEETVVRNRESEKLATNQGASDMPSRVGRFDSRQPGAVNPDRSSGERLTASPQQMAMDSRGISPTTEVGAPAETQPFSIEGQAAERSILNKVIPEYPAGVDKEATIRIRFTVLPDGRVGQMIPIQKDYPRLEEITIRALKQWRFNPLPSGAEQSTVQGIITFRYELL
ncbi:MAG TPA: energy transducer TonB [bacterium]|nr:energy transducer TonB [bacterium]